MNNAFPPVISKFKNIFFIIAAFTVSAIFTSCSKEEIPYNTHIVLIDTNEPGVYTWSDMDDPNMGWETLENGTGNYSFTISDDKIILTSQKSIQSVSFLKGTMDTEGEPLLVTPKNLVERDITETPIFKIKFKN